MKDVIQLHDKKFRVMIPAAKIDEAVQAVAQLTRDLGNPTTISEVGATEEDLAPLAADAFADVCTPGNPRKATQEDILEIYRSLM